MRRLILVTVLVLGIATPAAAQVPSNMTFQGVLTDDMGVLFPDGNYDLTFKIYGVSTGGSALYTEAHTGVPVVRGGFSVILGSITPLTLPFDAPYWLGITVGTNPELTPRVPLTSSPYALGLRLPFSATVSSGSTPALDITDLDGVALSVADQIRLRDTVLEPTIGRFTSVGYTPGPDPPEKAGAALFLYDENGDPTLLLKPSAAATGGGAIQFYRAAGVSGGFIGPQNNGAGIGLYLYGDDRDIAMNTNLVGDDAVQLPPDAIDSAEILDEPGATSVTQGSFSVALSSSVTDIASTTIDCPAAGYVLVLASCQFGVSHVNGTLSSGFCGVSDNASSLPVNQDVALRLQAAMPTGTYAFPATVHGLFQVSAGSKTFYLLGQEGSGAQFTADDVQLTAIYLPTAYGTVTPTIVAGGGGESDATPVRAGLTATEIATDREASLTVNRTRIENELAQMKARMQQLEAEVAAEPRAVPVVAEGGVKP